MELTNSKRILLKASYVTTELTAADARRVERRPSRGLEKTNVLRQLALTPDEIARLRDQMPEHADEHLSRLLATAEELSHSNARLAGMLATIPASVFVRLAEFVAEERQARYWGYVAAAVEQKFRVAPVGRLHLERIEMYPVGTEKGELVFTVPLTPGETVTVSHKEWATSRDEYERIIEDYFESYSERGVSEKTDASMSAENESKHSKSFNFGATTSGGYGPVSVSVSVGLQSSAEDRQALKESTQSSREITEKASARSRQEHKVSVKLENTRGSEDLSYRTITNPNADKALRVDYFRMMRKWRVDQFRYGLRLTFDVAIPNPGATL